MIIVEIIFNILMSIFSLGLISSGISNLKRSPQWMGIIEMCIGVFGFILSLIPWIVRLGQWQGV